MSGGEQRVGVKRVASLYLLYLHLHHFGDAAFAAHVLSLGAVSEMGSASWICDGDTILDESGYTW